MRAAIAALVIVASLAIGGIARAADPVNAGVSLDRTTITVGERIALQVIVDADVGYAVSDPTIARQIGDFEVVQTQQSQKSQRGPQVRFIYRYAITAWSVGDRVLPAIEIPWAGPNGTSGVARTADTAVAVVTVVRPGGDVSDIKPLKPQLGLPEATVAAIGRVAVGLAGAALAPLLIRRALWLFLRRGRIGIAGVQLTPRPSPP